LIAGAAVLDMGTGRASARFAARWAGRVVAVDINLFRGALRAD
jgi:hypothetical protein